MAQTRLWKGALGVGLVAVMLVGVLWVGRGGESPRTAKSAEPRAAAALPPKTPEGEPDECARVIRTMPSLLRHNRVDSYSTAMIAEYADLLRAYDRACFNPYEALSPAGKAVVGTVAGALFLKAGGDGEERIRCSAFRLSPSVVATARHCLLLGSDAGVLASSAFTFRLFGAPDTAFPVQGDVPGQHLRPTDASEPRATRDYWMLQVDTQSVPMPDTATFVVESPKADERLPIIVVGPNLFLPALAGEQGKNWRDWIRYDNRDFCNTLADEQGCLPHRCNTLKGMSGAPIIAKRGNGPDHPYILIGLHLRSAESSDPVCGRDPEGNLGIALPAALREHALAAARAEPRTDPKTDMGRVP